MYTDLAAVLEVEPLYKGQVVQRSLSTRVTNVLSLCNLSFVQRLSSSQR